MWEDSFIIPQTKTRFRVLNPVSDYTTRAKLEDETTKKLSKLKDIRDYVGKDKYPLPLTEDREGYHDDRHYDYWLSGLKDFFNIHKSANAVGLNIGKHSRVLDLGCASGRTLRHFGIQSEVEAWGCDISENHVLWCNKYLPKKIKVFQNTSLPHLQIEDNFFDIIYAMSVFTHVESFETSWLCELNRILRPGGIAYVTIHDENSWKHMNEHWGPGNSVMKHPDFKKKWLKSGFPGNKFVSRWYADKSYSSNVFYKLSYIKQIWGKFFEICEIIPDDGSAHQTVLVMRKRPSS